MTPRAKKTFIAGGIALFVMLGACVACGFGAWSSVTGWATGLQRDGERVSGEADQFAQGRDSNACVTEGLRRDDACPGITCQAEAGVFMERCLDRAAPVPGFCDGVPAQTEIMQSAQWAVTACAAQGHQGPPCTNLMQGVQRYCQRVRTGAP